MITSHGGYGPLLADSVTNRGQFPGTDVFVLRFQSAGNSLV
jgi:hypothetical protein